MTTQQLAINFWEQIYNNIRTRYGVSTPSRRLNYCSAWTGKYEVVHPETGEVLYIDALQSYGTLAAIGFPTGGEYKVFRFLTHSATTCQHCCKFGKQGSMDYYSNPYNYKIFTLDVYGVDKRIYQRGNL